jgi:RHS repeat-associated protein
MRVKKLTQDGEVRYSYDGDSVLAQYDQTGQTLAKYEYGPDQLLSLNHTLEGRQYYHFDALGSVASLTKPDASIQARYQYDAWGNERQSAGASFNRFGYTGHEQDEETGLYYFKARFYDPDTGRFLTQDSYLGDVNTAPSLHRYLYAYANPTVWVDLDGYESTRWDSEEEIPHGTNYWVISRGSGPAAYYSADKSSYEDSAGYESVAGMAGALGSEQRTMEKGLLTRIGEAYNSWHRGDDAKTVAESDSGPAVEPDDIAGQIQAQRRSDAQRNIQSMLSHGKEVARENTPDAERVAETFKEEGIVAGTVLATKEAGRILRNPLLKGAGKLGDEITDKKVLAAEAKAVDAAKSATSRRVTLRKNTMDKIKENQPRNSRGEMVDPYSGEPLKDGEIDVGHKRGQEWRKRKQMHEEAGSTRREVIEAENDPDLYHLEDRSSNRSHRNEEPWSK